jgi:hypothetical protein
MIDFVYNQSKTIYLTGPNIFLFSPKRFLSTPPEIRFIKNLKIFK